MLPLPYNLKLMFMKKFFMLLSFLIFGGGNMLTAQSLKKQNQLLQTQNVALSDSIRSLTHALDSVVQLRTKLAADYEKMKFQSGNTGARVDSLMKANQLHLSEIYALQVTNDSLNSRLQVLLAEKKHLQFCVDSLMALQERKLEENRQKELWERSSWFNISYSKQKINSELYRSELKPDYAVGITYGKTYYLHKKPLANMLRFALNWSYIDLNMAQYSVPYSDRIDGDESFLIEEGESTPFQTKSLGDAGQYDYGEDIYGEDEEGSESSSSQYKMELGMQIGPAIIVNPVSHLMIQAYFHYAPTFSMLLDDDFNFYNKYASFFNSGVCISYKAIGVGVEARWGTTTYSQEVYNIQTEDYEPRNMKWKTKGARVYLSFRF